MEDCNCDFCTGNYEVDETRPVARYESEAAQRRDTGFKYRIFFDGEFFNVETYAGELVDGFKSMTDARKLLRELEAEDDSASPEITDIGDGSLRIDHRQRKVYVEGRAVTMTAKEYALLLALIEKPITVQTRAELMQRVWGYQSDSTRTLDAHMCRLRGKLFGARVNYVVNTHGIGYRLMDSVEVPQIKTGAAR